MHFYHAASIPELNEQQSTEVNKYILCDMSNINVKVVMANVVLLDRINWGKEEPDY